MEYPMRVYRGEPTRHINADAEDLLPRQGLGYPLQTLAGNELRDQVRKAAEDTYPVDRDDVRVVHSRQRPGLDEEALAESLGGGAGDQELDGYRSVKERIMAEKNLSHPTAAERRSDVILIDLGDRRRRRQGLGDEG